MNKILQIVLNFIFPIQCVNCNSDGEFLCNDCFNKIELRNVLQCPLCNRDQVDDKLCIKCKSKSYLDEIIICANYDNVVLQKIIHYFKYKYIKDLSKPLEKILKEKYLQITLPSNLIIIPTPLHKKRQIERGFNQSELIAQKLNLPLTTNVLYRKKNIKHQADLNKEEREKNIKDCFSVKNTHLVINRNILLIDDVITTGSTLNEQARLLKQNNAHKVWALTIAKN